MLIEVTYVPLGRVLWYFLEDNIAAMFSFGKFAQYGLREFVAGAVQVFDDHCILLHFSRVTGHSF